MTIHHNIILKEEEPSEDEDDSDNFDDEHVDMGMFVELAAQASVDIDDLLCSWPKIMFSNIYIKVIQRSFSFSPGDYVLVNIPSLRFHLQSIHCTDALMNVKAVGLQHAEKLSFHGW